MPGCNKELVEAATKTDDQSLVGENCHIAGDKPGAARHDPALPDVERDAYANHILCCRNCHRMIDDQPGEYTVEVLHRIKKEHEDRVRAALRPSDVQQDHDNRAYRLIVDRIAEESDFENWIAWVSSMLSHGQPKMQTVRDERLFELSRWLARRPKMPGRYPSLEAAIRNFACVLVDMQDVFRRHAVPFGKDRLITEKFYKGAGGWNPNYDADMARFEFHVDLVEDLAVELTRAANLVIEGVRANIDHEFWLAEGDLMIQTGPNGNFEFEELVVRYTEENLLHDPIYPGLEGFYALRATRDYRFGRGRPPT